MLWMEPGLALGKGMNLTFYYMTNSFVENNRCRQVKVYKSQFHFEYFISVFISHTCVKLLLFAPLSLKTMLFTIQLAPNPPHEPHFRRVILCPLVGETLYILWLCVALHVRSVSTALRLVELSLRSERLVLFRSLADVSYNAPFSIELSSDVIASFQKWKANGFFSIGNSNISHKSVTIQCTLNNSQQDCGCKMGLYYPVYIC